MSKQSSIELAHQSTQDSQTLAGTSMNVRPKRKDEAIVSSALDIGAQESKDKNPDDSEETQKMAK